MRQHKQTILVTRPLSGKQLEYARILGLEPIIRPALEFEFPQYWDKVLKVINQNQRADWVFTSANAVKALEELLDSGLQPRPELEYFAVGRKTAEALQKLGLHAKVPSIHDGDHLAELIIEHGSGKPVIHFQGNMSRDEMAVKLRANQIEVIDLPVYKTIINAVDMPAKKVGGILFYSPSAVEGFARGKGFDTDLPPLFAIGDTTAKVLKEQTGQSVVVSPRADTEALLRTVADHIFNTEAVEN